MTKEHEQDIINKHHEILDNYTKSCFWYDNNKLKQERIEHWVAVWEILSREK